KIFLSAADAGLIASSDGDPKGGISRQIPSFRQTVAIRAVEQSGLRVIEQPERGGTPLRGSILAPLLRGSIQSALRESDPLQKGLHGEYITQSVIGCLRDLSAMGHTELLGRSHGAGLLEQPAEQIFAQKN